MYDVKNLGVLIVNVLISPSTMQRVTLGLCCVSNAPPSAAAKNGEDSPLTPRVPIKREKKTFLLENESILILKVLCVPVGTMCTFKTGEYLASFPLFLFTQHLSSDLALTTITSVLDFCRRVGNGL
jgi:hypothetical protein